MRKIAFIGIVAVSAVAGFLFLFNNNRPSISPIQDGPSKKVLGIFSSQKDPTALKKKIQNAVGNTWKNYSVYVVDYNSNFQMGINESETFTAASVNKIPILAALYYKAQKGETNLDKVVTLQTEDIQDYGTGSIRYDPPGTTYSIKTLARLMMQQSDNTAAFLLGDYEVGLPTVQAIINSWGLSQTDMVNNKTSNRDMALLLDKIYKNTITGPTLTAEMLGFMRDSDFEDRIPAGVPKDASVYHKVGTSEGAIHDVGIVTRGTTTYYIGIFSADVQDIDGAPKLSAKISKIVWDFMQ